ncbi:MAG: hypothetical protein RL562_1618 [Planctomycetota bacterium]
MRPGRSVGSARARCVGGFRYRRPPCSLRWTACGGLPMLAPRLVPGGFPGAGSIDFVRPHDCHLERSPLHDPSWSRRRAPRMWTRCAGPRRWGPNRGLVAETGRGLVPNTGMDAGSLEVGSREHHKRLRPGREVDRGRPGGSCDAAGVDRGRGVPRRSPRRAPACWSVESAVVRPHRGWSPDRGTLH